MGVVLPWSLGLGPAFVCGSMLLNLSVLALFWAGHHRRSTRATDLNSFVTPMKGKRADSGTRSNVFATKVSPTTRTHWNVFCSAKFVLKGCYTIVLRWITTDSMAPA